MRRLLRKQSELGSGHDSFLDIVANLVGILVILIMVVGVRARNAYRSSQNHQSVSIAVPSDTSSLQELESKVGSKNTEVLELQRDAFRLEAKMKQVSHQADMKKAERDQLQLLVAAAKADLDERRAALDNIDRSRSEASQLVSASQHELQQIELNIQAVKSASAKHPNLLKHYPTPLAKMVFGREEHFRLMNRRLVYVPINGIVEQLRNDAEKKLWKFEETDEITETIGPIGGFRVKYTMQRRERRVKTEQGTALKRTIELAQFTLVPVGERMGKSIEEALSQSSQFRQFIESLDPSDTTITVWTYPDSFVEYRQFKDELEALGFRTAARPMPDGQPIGGSPAGTRSAAE